MLSRPLNVTATVAIMCVRGAYVQSATGINTVHKHRLPHPILFAQVIRTLVNAKEIDPKVLVTERAGKMERIKAFDKTT